MGVDIASFTNVVISASDQTKSAWESVRAEANKTAAEMQKFHDKMMNPLNALKTALGALGIALSVAGFVELIRGAIDAADHLNDLSKTTGIAVEQLAGLRVAAKQSGGDLDSIAASVNKLAVNMGKDAEKFKALGITAKDPLEAFKQLADVFVALEDPQQRAAVMATALGKSWAGAAPLLAEGGQKIGELVTKGSELSGMSKQMAEDADAFNDKLVLLTGTGGMMTRMVAPLLPLLNTLADDMLEAQKRAGDLGNGFSPLLETGKAVVVLFGNVSFVLKTIGNDLGATAAQIAAFASGDFKQIFAIRDMAIADAAEARKKFDAWEQSILAVGTAARKTGAEIEMVDAKGRAAAAARAAAFLADAKATEDNQKAYLSLIRSIEEKTAATDKELAGQEKLTEAQKIALAAMLKLQDGTLKLTQAQKVRLAAELEGMLASERALIRQTEKTKAYVAILTDSIAAQQEIDVLLSDIPKKRDAGITSLQSAIEQIQFETTLIGQSNEERTIAIALRELETAGIKKGTSAYEAMAESLRAVVRARGSAGAVDSFSKQLEQMEFERTLIGSSNAEREKAIMLRALDASAIDKQGIAYAELSQKIKDSITLKDWTQELSQLTNSLTDALLNAWENGKSGVKAFMDWLKAEFSRLVLRPIVNAVVNSGVNAAMGMVGAASGDGGVMSALGTGQSAYSGATNMATLGTAAYNWFAGGGASAAASYGVTGVSTIGATVGAGAAAEVGAAAAGAAGSTALGAGAAEGAVAVAGATGWVPIVGWVIAIAALVYAVVASNQEPSAVRAGMAMRGPYEDNTPPTHTAFGDIGFSDSATQQFSGKVGQAFSNAIGQLLDMGAKQISPEAVATVTAKLNSMVMLSFEGTYSTEDFLNVFGPRMAKQLFDPMLAEVDPYAQQLVAAFDGPLADLLAYTGDILTVTGAIKANSAVFQKLFGEAIDLKKIEAVTKEGESFSAALSRVAAEFSATNDIARIMGKTQQEVWGAVGLASEAARAQLIAFAGGAQNLSDQLNYYYQHFYSESERQSASLKMVKDAFVDLGMEMPATREAFRHIMEGIDLSTEAGRKLYAALLKLAPAFDTVTASVNNALRVIVPLLQAVPTINWGNAPAGAGGIAVLGSAAPLGSTPIGSNVLPPGSRGIVLAPPRVGTPTAAETDAAAKAMQEAAAKWAAALAEMTTAAGVSADQLGALIKKGLLGEISGEELGQQMSDMIINGIYSAMANQAAGQVSAIISQYLITPIMSSILAGSGVTAAINATLTKANIDAMIAGATAAVSTLGAIFDDPSFKAAMAQLSASLHSLGASMGGAARNASSAAAAHRQATSAQDSAAARLADATLKWRESLNDWLRGNALGDLSPLTAQQKLEEARRQYEADRILAAGGDQGARDRLTREAEAYLEAQRAVSGFGGDYSAIYARIRAEIAALAGPAAGMGPGDVAINRNIVELNSTTERQTEVLGRLLERVVERLSQGTVATTAAISNNSAVVATAIDKGSNIARRA